MWTPPADLLEEEEKEEPKDLSKTGKGDSKGEKKGGKDKGEKGEKKKKEKPRPTAPMPPPAPASFPGLQVDAIGSGFTIVFEATRLGRMLSVVSGQFSMRGRLGGIAATQFPSGGMTFEKLQPPVILNAVDEAYNLCPWYETLTCRVELADHPAERLAGSTTEGTMVAGIATFDNLKINTIGSGYQLHFTCEGGYRMVQVKSPFFTVTNPIDQLDGMRLVVMPDVSTFQVGRPLVPLPELRVYDDRGDVVSGSVNTVTVRVRTACRGSLRRRGNAFASCVEIHPAGAPTRHVILATIIVYCFAEEGDGN